MVKKKDPGANRVHRERGQVGSRGRLGLLEKHKDYVHRARDYKSKQDRIRKLREKAAFRNKDEFYWGMVKGKTKNGVAIGDRGNEALSVDTVKLLKTQDVGYVRLQIAKDQKKVAKLRAELESILPPSDPDAEWDAVQELKEVEQLAEMGIVVRPRGEMMQTKKKGKNQGVKEHITFAEDKSTFDAVASGSKIKRNNVASSSKTTLDGNAPRPSAEIEDLGWDDLEVPSRSAPAEVELSDFDEDEEEQTEKLQAHRMQLYTLLSAHLARIRELRIAETKLGTHLGLAGKGSARKVQKGGWVEDENAPEDRNGDRKTLQRNVFKYKLPRRT